MILKPAMRLLSLLFKDPVAFVLLIVPLFYSVILHEVAHGWVANKMGDPTAKWLGRLTLDPRKHFDPVGTIMLFIFGFGWAKPVPVNFNNLKDPRKGLIFVSAAGITANVVLAFISLFTLQLLAPQSRTVTTVLDNFAGINIMLAAFNLIPIPPLDGSKILMGFASRRFQYSLAQLEPYGMFIIIGLLALHLLDPVISFLMSFLEWAILQLISLVIP